MTKMASMILGGVSLLWATIAAAATPEQVCEAAKSKAIGKKAACITNERAKEVKGRSADYGKCSSRFSTAFAKAEASAVDHGANCLTTGDAAALSARIDTQFATTTGLTSALSGVRFIDNGDGTVSDTHTCLMWEMKDSMDGIVDFGNAHDADNKYSWGTQTAASGTVFSDFLHRLNYCTTNDGDTVIGGFAGYCDWRVPSIAELKTIQGTIPGCSSADLCIAPIFGPTQESYYMSSTTIDAFPAFLYEVQFLGPIGSGSLEKTVSEYVRAVRGVRCAPGV